MPSKWCNPVGDPANRVYPPGSWAITNHFLNVYELKDSLAVHTGEDVNLPAELDVGEVVRAIGDGKVVFAEVVKDSTWMGLVVIQHEHDDTFTCSRYGHLKDLTVSKNDTVAAGQMIGRISETDPIDNVFPPHLHFDIGKTGDRLLIDAPQHWPDKKETLEKRSEIVDTHYQQPKAFLQPRLDATEFPPVDEFGNLIPPRPPLHVVVNVDHVNVRTHRRIADDTFVRELLEGFELDVADPPVEMNNIVWREIVNPADLRGKFVVEHIHPAIDPRIYLVMKPDAIPVPPPPEIPVIPEPDAPPAPPPAHPTPLPPGRLRMRVNIAQVNVRSKRLINEQTFVREIKEGFELIVVDPPVEEANIVWREIVEPEDLRGNFVAEHIHPAIDSRIYLVPVEPGAVVDSGETPVDDGPVALSLGPEPAPLVGRFRLVPSSSPSGPCTGLKIDDQTRPALGVNVRELAYFGEPQWGNTQPEDRGGFCDVVRAMNMRWVRFFAAHADFSEDDIVEHTRAALDAIADRGLLAVVVFADSIKNIKLYPAGDEPSHNVSDLNHLNKDYFRDKLYRDHYLPLVVRLVTEFRNHPGVGMWQLMNEPAIYPAPATTDDVDKFGEFVDEVSARIYQLDKTHPISIGMVNCAHILPPGLDLNQFAHDFYAQRRHIHVVSCHSYQKKDTSDSEAAWDFEDNANADIQAAAQTGRAVFWTEFGASQAADRVLSTRRFLNRHLNQQRASGALQWAFMTGPSFAPDKGVGDHDFGFSNAPFNKQFQELRDLFTGFLDTLTQ